MKFASKELNIGEIFDSNLYGKFKIVREIIDIDFSHLKSKPRIYEVEFLDTGYHTISSGSNILSGSVKDRMVPSVDGVGYMGQDNIWFPYGTKSQSYDKKLYKVWNGMLDRCYKETDINYVKYGAIGVRVDPALHEFFQFERDVKLLPGYNLMLQYPNLYQLDKDYLQSNIPTSQRVYSKNTCLWISYYENLVIVGKENGLVPYYGVKYKNSQDIFDVRMQVEGYSSKEIYFGRYKTPEEAANLFNYIYPLVIPPHLNSLNLHNDVPDLGFKELMRRNLLNKKDNLYTFLAAHHLPIYY
jgi:hypothetical protein